MELKYQRESAVTTLRNSINRTFMELKYARAFSAFASGKGINRTFMELKFDRTHKIIKARSVLIEPSWN